MITNTLEYTHIHPLTHPLIHPPSHTSGGKPGTAVIAINKDKAGTAVIRKKLPPPRLPLQVTPLSPIPLIYMPPAYY